MVLNRMLVALTVDPRFSVESYDLSGTFLGTELRDRVVYVRLPAEAGEYAGKVLLLLKSLRRGRRLKQGSPG